MLKILFVDLSGVRYRQDIAFSALGNAHIDRHFAAVVAVLNRVVGKRDQHLLEPIRVGESHVFALWHVQRDRLAARLGGFVHPVRNVVKDLVEFRFEL